MPKGSAKLPTTQPCLVELGRCRRWLSLDRNYETDGANGLIEQLRSTGPHQAINSCSLLWFEY
eukprot:12473813-Alexandrium_andersonii.AAC.1